MSEPTIFLEPDDDEFRLHIESRQVQIIYTNWKGETGVRRITPYEIYFGSTRYHPVEQWLLRAYDQEKKAWRDFALEEIQSWKPFKESTDARK